MNKRASGILHHITSLPSAWGIGDLGPSAYAFADFLCQSKQRYWQTLPLNPTNLLFGSSPYHSSSSCAKNPLLISPEFMVREGFLKKEDLAAPPGFPVQHVDYPAVAEYKERLFRLAYKRFSKQKTSVEYERFCHESAAWLDDYALYVSLKAHFNGATWDKWPRELRDRHPKALQSIRQKLSGPIEMVRFLQFVFTRQWFSLKHYCNQKNIEIIGDVPIYVVHDCVDVWSNPDIFKLDEEKRPYVVAGVPPDYFSETGQLWGNPVYRWDVLQARKYDWWTSRLAHNLSLFDIVRIDHFRGLVAFWEVPASEETAIDGTWVTVPAMDFFDHLAKNLPALPLIAEDLGLITPDVKQVLRQLEFPGMKVLLFAFGDDMPANPYIPHNIEKNCIVYTGTHDNNTARGWFEHEATPREKKNMFQYLGRNTAAGRVPGELMRLAMMSVANTCIFPTQDVLALGQKARMNRPGTARGNWRWRLAPGQLTPRHAHWLHDMTVSYARG